MDFAGIALVAGMTLLFAAPAFAGNTTDLNRWIRTYSTQKIVDLDIGESVDFKLDDGTSRVVKLVSVDERRDTVVNLVRRAVVHVELDGKPLVLVCEPYQMPTETQGLRLQVDSTSGWGNTPKRIQLSLWDARKPIVDVKRFTYPLPSHLLFSHPMQAYGEPVHGGAGDDDPVGQVFYHDYGFDIAGYEKREAVVSAVAGKVVRFWPSRTDVCSVLIADAQGFVWEHAHLSAIDEGIQLGTVVRVGTRIGTMGKTGPSGNLAHLHLGTYGTLADTAPNAGDVDRPNKRLNLYPWLVTAYRAQHKGALFAVARPHHIAKTGEKVVFAGSHSLAWGGAKIVEYRWVFPDGSTAKGPTAEKTFEKPGAYIVELWVKNAEGQADVDFCQVKIYSASNTEQRMPHFYLSSFPIVGIEPGRPVKLQGWMQGETGGPIRIAFDDGSVIENYNQSSEIEHRFDKPGIHVVTATCVVDGKAITQKLKVVVSPKR